MNFVYVYLYFVLYACMGLFVRDILLLGILRVGSDTLTLVC